MSASEPLIARVDERKPLRPTRIGVSTYSFWQFKNEDYRDLEKCIDLAGEMGFDAVEILHRQMKDETPGYLQKLKQRAFREWNVSQRILHAPRVPLSTKGRATEERRSHVEVH